MTEITTWIASLFPNGGYYVEAGAHDGVGDSQTYELSYQLGLGKWKGLCIEPSSAYKGLKDSRESVYCHVDNRCLWSFNGQVTFREIQGEAIELSGIPEAFCDTWERELRPHKDEIRNCITLTSILKEFLAPKVIEFLALDTEGSEFTILKVHDFNKYRFLAIEVEHNGVGVKRSRIYSLLCGEEGYVLDHSDSVNDYYLYKGPLS